MASSSTYGTDIVGRRVEVLWERDSISGTDTSNADGVGWYRGVISKYDVARQEHLIEYNDGDKDWYDLGKVQFRLIIGNDDDKKDLMFVKTETLNEHEDKVTCLDCLPKKQLFVSGSLDGFVKIWNTHKEMVREIKFPEPIYSVSFLNPEGDLIVGHMGKVSTVSTSDYQPAEIPKLCNPPSSDTALFYSSKSELATESMYLRMKQRDDDIRR